MSWAGFDTSWLDEQRAAGRTVADVAAGRTGAGVAPANGRARRRAGESSRFSSEAELQAQVIILLRGMGLPAYATVNEHPGTARYMAGLVAQGLTAGIPDVVVPVPSARYGVSYGALYIELKHGANDLTPAQAAQICALMEAGNACTVCRTPGQVRTFTLEYLHSPETFVGGC